MGLYDSDSQALTTSSWLVKRGEPGCRDEVTCIAWTHTFPCAIAPRLEERHIPASARDRERIFLNSGSLQARR
jgi:hypothetical protein